jgi:hypothetical protein
MTSLQTYPRHSQATAWLHRADLFLRLRIGKPGCRFGVQAANMRPILVNFASEMANEDLTKEANR